MCEQIYSYIDVKQASSITWWTQQKKAVPKGKEKGMKGKEE